MARRLLDVCSEEIMRPAALRAFFILVPGFALLACGDDDQATQEIPTYVSQAPLSSSGSGVWNGGGLATGDTQGIRAPVATGSETTKTGASTPVVPGGRVADVQEADVYKVADGKLYLLNTYRGFLIYDINDPKHPVRMGHLPVYGYPVEMFVENSTVYALLSDALYLTKVAGKLQFERRNSSQIVTIDIADPAHPKLLQVQDLAGQLREGVSRKIENTIYVVSYQPAGYWFYGWGPQTGATPNEEAWVYSFDASTPSNLKQVGKLKVFEGGSTNTYDQTTGESHSRYSSGVTLSATSNAIMVVQNWSTYDSVPGQPIKDSSGNPISYTCGSYQSDQQSVVSVVDVSDPAGNIQVAATFATEGALTDQFKQTYVFDAQANTGTYLGIFARNTWSGTGCDYTQQTQNTLEAWDIVGDGSAKQLSAVDFGKPNETVRGSYFDPDRKVAFAITARSMDPMYAISFTDRNNLKILSAIDGLSGDMDLFRPVEGGQYLLAVGRDTGSACATYVPGQGESGKVGASTQISVSLIDVRDLANIRLVQRKCLDVAGAGWVGSNVTWNLDQAHKMIGLDTSGPVSVLTVPVSYYLQDTSKSDWYWYRYETAVGIMSWDLSKYDDKLQPEQQSVITTHGHFVHPNGEVNRSVIYSQGASKQREMLNISDTHLSFANLQSLDSPTLDSVVELASGDQAVFRFGDYVVVQTDLPGNDYSRSGYEFRVKKAGGEIDDSPTIASFTVGMVQQVLRHGDNLILLRAVEKPSTDSYGNAITLYATQGLIYDLSNPASPKPLSTVDFPDDINPYASYYRYYCGMGYYGGYYLGFGQNMVSLAEGIAFLTTNTTNATRTVSENGSTRSVYDPIYTHSLAFLDLRDPAHPAISEQPLSLPGVGDHGAVDASLVADSAQPSSLYIGYKARIDSQLDPVTQSVIDSYANYAQRWERKSGTWSADGAINIPGTLVRSWTNATGARRFLTRDDAYTSKQQDNYWMWIDHVTLKLLAQVSDGEKSGAVVLGSKDFGETPPKSMVYDGSRIYAAISNSSSYRGYYLVDGPVGIGVGTASGVGGAASDPAAAGTDADTSDRLAILDTAQDDLATVFDAPTELTNLDLMGVEQDKLFVNLQGDGVLVVDVADASAPKATSFYRTLGWASGIELAGSSAYVPAGYYGTYRLDLTGLGNL
jgi:hypothetical protein